MSIIKNYVAAQAGAALELQEYDAGPLAAEDVEVQVDYFLLVQLQLVVQSVVYLVVHLVGY